MPCLLVASIFTPINGGSAVVYETLCRFAPPGSMVVLSPWRHYVDGLEVPGWREHDRRAPYPIYRLELLRPLMVDGKSSQWQSLWRQLTVDLPLKLRVFLEVWRIVRKHKIDVVCVGELVSGSWIGLACKRLLGCRMVSYIHGEEITAETEYRFFGRLRRHYLLEADAIVAVSAFTKATMVRKMGVDPRKVELIHNGVDIERFRPGPKRQDLIERHALQEKRLILTVGRLIPRKGFDVIIRALPQILAVVPDAHYVIVGGGHYLPVLQSLVDEGKLAAHVTFAGKVAEEDLTDYYRLCEIFAMPNRDMPDGDTEGFGLVFLEANACGKPVIGGSAGGAVEAVQDGENGLLVDGWSVDCVAEAIIRLLTDTALRDYISARGLEIARAASSPAKSDQFQALCARLTGHGEPICSANTRVDP